MPKQPQQTTMQRGREDGPKTHGRDGVSTLMRKPPLLSLPISPVSFFETPGVAIKVFCFGLQTHFCLTKETTCPVVFCKKDCCGERNRKVNTQKTSFPIRMKLVPSPSLALFFFLLFSTFEIFLGLLFVSRLGLPTSSHLHIKRSKGTRASAAKKRIYLIPREAMLICVRSD